MTEQQARDWSIRHASEMERQRKDAERYRWLRRSGVAFVSRPFPLFDERVDDVIDKSIIWSQL